MWVVQDTDWRKVRDSLTDSMTNFGQPILFVEDADYRHRGELFINHAFDGKELDEDYARRTLKNVQMLWGRPVHLKTVLIDRPTILSFDGEEFETEDD